MPRRIRWRDSETAATMLDYGDRLDDAVQGRFDATPVNDVVVGCVTARSRGSPRR
jgi:hypothetical protein